MVKRYGWRRDLPDHRDEAFRWSNPAQLILPPSVKLEGPAPVFDQGQLGSCTANAISSALMFEMGKDVELPTFIPSRLFIYYNEREIEGDVDHDNGAEIRDGIKSVASQGAVTEEEWPYFEDRFKLKPSDECYLNGQTFNAFTQKRILYQRVSQGLQYLKGCLASGYPFVFGFSVFESFESVQVAETGIIPMPSKEEALVGGHAVLAIGYDDSRNSFLVRNSWGSSWGLGGNFWMPYDYVKNAGLASDFWTIKLVK